MNLKNYDYHKIASASLRETDAEVAFYKASSLIIEDKAAPLFQGNFYLGFEIVKTNDAFTKMVGIYAFRINKHLFYIPVFYVDGKIKGTDFLYSVDEKKFVYLNPDWCEYYIGLYEQESNGHPVDAALSSQGVQNLEMLRIATPLYKSASISDAFIGLNDSFVKQSISDFTEAYKLAFTNFIESPDTDVSPLHSFIKSAGITAFTKLANTIKSDITFANNVVNLCNEKDYIPMDVIEESHNQVKKSANTSAKVDKLILHKGKFNKAGVKTAAEQITKGYSIEDNRDASNLSLIYDEMPNRELSGITSNQPSVYDIVTTDGSMVKCVAIAGNSDYSKIPALLVSIDDANKGIVLYKNINDDEQLYDYKPYSKVQKPGIHEPVIGIFRNILAQEELDPIEVEKGLDKVLKTKPEKGKIYGIYDSTHSYISDESFYIQEVKDTADEGSYTVKAFLLKKGDDGYTAFLPKDALHEYGDETIKVNANCGIPHYDLKVFTPAVRWIELPFKKVDLGKELTSKESLGSNYSFKPGDVALEVIQADFVPGNWNTVSWYDQSLLRDPKLASIKIDCYSPKTFDVEIMGKKFAGLNAMGSTLMLMSNANISEDLALSMLKYAKDEKHYQALFYKFADRIILDPEPDFFEGFDSDLGVTYQIPESRVIPTEETSYAPPAPRYGDMMQPSVSSTEGNSRVNNDTNDFLETATPNMLAELAEKTGKSSVFEHGIIASLSKVTDAQLYINEFLPSLRDGMDKLARLLFLLLISPQNFVKYYGSDDILDLETSINSTFRQLSDLTLDLIQRTSGIATNITNRNS